MTDLHIRKADLTELKVDAVVNAANTQLEEGGGVCGAIFARVGRNKLRRACKKIGYCKTGNAVITDGFDLNADYIIHAVGPVWKGGNNDEEYLLASAYRNALETAMINGCHSIGFPLISAGIYGYPKQQAWDIALRICLAFMENFEEAGLSITFAVIDDEMLALGNQILENLKSGNSI